MSRQVLSTWSFRRLVPPFPLFQSHRTSSSTNNIPRPLDWKPHQSTHAVSTHFNIISFNLLAPVYKRLQSLDLHTGNRKRESQNQELWRGRAQRTVQFLRDEILPDTDILGMQEFWVDPHYQSIFENDFRSRGFELRHLQRSGGKLDAVALAIKKSVFRIVDSDNVYLCTLSDRVALVLWLQHLETGRNVLVANTHLSFPHTALDKLNQIRQMKTLTSTMEEFANRHGITHAARIIIGDFNVEYTSAVCEHLRSDGYVSCFEVSMPQNSRVAPHSLIDADLAVRPRSQTRSLKFVSHRNHRAEELGVDHIFVRGEGVMVDRHSSHQDSSLQDSSHQDSSSNNSSVNEGSTTDESTTSTVTRNVIPHAASIVKASQQPKQQEQGQQPEEKKEEEAPDRLFIDHCRVLPSRVPCTEWDRHFMISDHRPVGATLIFAHAVNAEQLRQAEQEMKKTTFTVTRPASPVIQPQELTADAASPLR